MTTLKVLERLGERYKYDTILKPPEHPRRSIEEPDILGFDMEWDYKTDKLLSVQLAWYEGDQSVSHVFYRGRDFKVVTKTKLLDMVRKCLPWKTRPVIILVSYFSTGDIGHIQDAMKVFHLRPYSRALEAETHIEFRPEPSDDEIGVTGIAKSRSVTLRITDLYGFLRGGLDKLAKSIGLKELGFAKVKLDGLGGHDEKYWKKNMGQLLKEHPKEFERYSKMDALITLIAYTQFRKFFKEQYDLDMVNFQTASSLSMYLFRTEYLRAPVAPTIEVAETYHRRNENNLISLDGVGERTERYWRQNLPRLRIDHRKIYDEWSAHEWKTGTRLRPALREDWHLPRYYSMLSYWGGRAEAYGRGLLETDLTYYDVNSLYPSSAALQPLPNADTNWTTFRTYGETKGLEGFACVSFKFPPTQDYPCLPVMGFRSGKLYFPLEGEHCWCTLSEVREAKEKLGADITDIFGVGFEPHYSEINHPLKSYAKKFMDLKNESKDDPKSAYKYQLYKMLLNGPIGKFWETEKDFMTGRILKQYKSNVVKWKDVKDLHKDWSKVVRRNPRRTGSAWWPEAASLILGKARALMSQFISKGALMAITDSVLLPRGTSLECDALTALKTVGSYLDIQVEAKKAWIMRTKVYALWKSNGEIFARRHGFDMPQEDFEKWVNDSVGKELVELPIARGTHIESLKRAVQTGRRLGSEEIHESHPKRDWDGKRIQEPVELFRNFKMFRPLQRIPDQVEPRGRPRKGAKNVLYNYSRFSGGHKFSGNLEEDLRAEDS
jgi:hypothetical protein